MLLEAGAPLLKQTDKVHNEWVDAEMKDGGSICHVNPSAEDDSLTK